MLIISTEHLDAGSGSTPFDLSWSTLLAHSKRFHNKPTAYSPTRHGLWSRNSAFRPSGHPAENRKAAPAKLSNTMDRDTRDNTPENPPNSPTPNTGTAREKEGAQTEESLRHNGLLSLPTAAKQITTSDKACLSDAAAATEGGWTACR